MRAIILPASEADELAELRVMRDMIAEQLELPPGVSVKQVTIAARLALAKLAVEEALAVARMERLNAQIAGRAA